MASPPQVPGFWALEEGEGRGELEEGGQIRLRVSEARGPGRAHCRLACNILLHLAPPPASPEASPLPAALPDTQGPGWRPALGEAPPAKAKAPP